MRKQELLDTINNLVIMFNHYAKGTCEAHMARDGRVTYFGKAHSHQYHFYVPESLMKALFLGKPGDTYTMLMTPEFQELMEEEIGEEVSTAFHVTFSTRKPDYIEATFHIEELPQKDA